MNFNFKKLPPFKWFVLQNFPFIEADFDAITYYQLLCKIVEYLNKVIDENNLIGEQTENLTNAFNELQDYVNHYFDNLDIQNEINNKLDEMAESGQLTDIIAQYLELAGVLAYDTVADLKNADNLSNGSIAKTLGNTTYNDGYGAFYKIRTVLNTDVVDNDNIVALNNFNNLVAEKIYNKNLNFLPNFYVGAFFKVENEQTIDNFFTSIDGINFNKIEFPLELNARDISINYNKKNKTFYIVVANKTENSNFRIYYSKNLINWNYKDIYGGISTMHEWAPDLSIDNDGNMFVIESFYYGNDVNKYGNSTLGFDMYISKCEFSNINNLEFSNFNKLNIESVASHRNHIDGNLLQLNNTYYLICKDEYQKTIEIYSTEDFETFNLINNNITNSSLKLEAPQLIKEGNKIRFIADMFENNNYITSVCNIDDFPNFTNFDLLNGLNNYRHGSIFYVDDNYMKNAISNNISDFTFLTDINNIKKEPNIIILNQLNSLDLIDMPIIPNTLYKLMGTSDLTITSIKNIFNQNYMNFMFLASNGIKFNILKIDDISYTNEFLIKNSYGINEQMNKIAINDNLGLNCGIYTSEKKGTIEIDNFATLVNNNFELTQQKCFVYGDVVYLRLAFKALANTTILGTMATLNNNELIPVDSFAIIASDFRTNINIGQNGSMDDWSGTSINQNQTIYYAGTYIRK